MFRHLRVCLAGDAAEILDSRNGERVARGPIHEMRDHLDYLENNERYRIRMRAKRIAALARKNRVSQVT